MKNIRVLILGGGDGSAELINSVHRCQSCKIIGVVDKDASSAGIKLAQKLAIPTAKDYTLLSNKEKPDIILNITSKRKFSSGAIARKYPGVEIIEDRAIRLMAHIAENQPSEKESEYQSVFKNMSSGVAYHRILTDKDGRAIDYVFLEINRAFERLIGLKKDQVVGKKITEVMPSIKSSMFDWINFYGKVASSGKEVNFEQYFKDLNKWYAVSAYSPRKGYFITIYTDITERKNAEESLRKAYDTLKKTQAQLIQTEKMEVVGKLASGVAHEVKNPLSIILQGTYFLNKTIKKRDKNINFVLGSMNDAVKRAIAIINDLLAFSRLPSMQMVKEDLNSVIISSLLLTKNDAVKSHVDVSTDLDKDLPGIVLDRNRIQQVLLNVFMNAIQSMSKGGNLNVKSYRESGAGEKYAVIEEIGRAHV